MAWELSITSAPRGLKPGSAGFCPVSHTRGMPPHLIERLEAISGYRHLEIGAESAERNPVVQSHTILRLSGETYYVLSRICDAGRDYSGRSNRFAYHLVLKPHELVPAGPAALLQVPNLMRACWDGQVGLIPTERVIPKLTVQPRPCTSWQQALGDAGWAGILAQRFLADSQKTIYFIYPMEVDILKLFDEVIALLPESHRWKVTFSTFDQGLGEVAICRWRAIPAHAPEATEMVKKRGLEVWDLRIKRGIAPSGPESVAAREGRPLELLAPQKVAAPIRDFAVTQPVTSAAMVPSQTDQEVPYLELADSTDTPPPLWRASIQGGARLKKRRPWSFVVIVSVVMLLLGLILGLGTGFVLWSGVLMPPVLPGIAGNAKKPQVQNEEEKLPDKPASEKPARRREQEQPPKEGEPAEKTPPQKEGLGDADDKGRQDGPTRPTEEKAAKPDQPKSQTPAGGNAPAEDASQPPVKPNGTGQSSSTPSATAQRENDDVGKGETVALPFSELPIAQLDEILLGAEQTNLPGKVTARAWTTKPLWSVNAFDRENRFTLLKVVDRDGQSRYYVRWPGTAPFGKTKRIPIGTNTEFESASIEGVRSEIRCVGGWRKGESDTQYYFRAGDRDRISLKIQQAAAKIRVSADSLDRDNDRPLGSVTAEIGFHITEETGAKIWVPMLTLTIEAK